MKEYDTIVFLPTLTAMIFITSAHRMAIKDKNNDSDIIKGNNYDNDNGYDP